MKKKSQYEATRAAAAPGGDGPDRLRCHSPAHAADEHRLPFDVEVPSTTTRKAIEQLEAGKGKHFDSVDNLMTDLHADD